MKQYGSFDDATRSFVITDPLTPGPWINYLGNRRLQAFISQQAGGLCWYKEPQTRRLTRYHWLPAPSDRPGFYLYVRDHQTGVVWNPHFAPTCAALERYACRHAPGVTSFTGERDGVRITVRYFVPPGHDVLLWDVTAENLTNAERKLTLASFTEFGLLDAARELWWCYLKNQVGFHFDAAENWIRYDYHVFEAPYTPAIFMSCTEAVSGFECSRDAFCGKGGSLERPLGLTAGTWSNSQLPGGGHGAGVLGVELELAAGATRRLGYVLGVAPDWTQAAALRQHFSQVAAFDEAHAALQEFWANRATVLQASTGDAHADRMINTWNPLNCEVALNIARGISTDHMGVDGLRFRDTMQDALAMTVLDPARAAERVKLVLSFQGQDGSGNFAFWPDSPDRRVSLHPVRCDNTVWPVMTVDNLVKETGDIRFLEESVPFREGGAASVYEHIRRGLCYIDDRRGPHGLPLLFHADWNDGLAIFRDERAESVMLGMQMVYAAKLFAPLARRLGRTEDAAWAEALAVRYTEVLNSDVAWDGAWYARLLLSNGKRIGTAGRSEGRIYLEPQAWSVISGVGDFEGRGRRAMDAAREHLDTECGLMICAPPYTGIPEPTDPLTGNAPGTGENGAIFCHANTWAVIAECLLGRGDQAYAYYRKMLPSVAAERRGQDHWVREPYAFNSTVLGPARGDDFGAGGIGWLTGTASWMYVAATQYLLGIRPDWDDLQIKPCLPAVWGEVTVDRRFRGQLHRIGLRRRNGAVAVSRRLLDSDT